ncbi:MAG: 50S ribosomal protein L6 [Candidatus Riflebacteria bacterium HGW-Riflebacteria-2]|jgi:large subunit ribosomal protein L6|nr:ribosomal protein L6 [uncultured bacterium]PKL42076.1 MAG: 50S ribosomal protein L6 [Candidatus Riflebacteria bacterium HGW-Riflebacteria-2]
MSRIGKKPVIIPKGVEISIKGNVISVKGPKGQLSREMPAEVKVAQEEDKIVCTIPENSSKPVRSKFGLVRALVNNMVTGVHTGFTRGLEIIGVGYKAQNQGDSKIQFNIGYSHPVVYEAPANITLKVEGNKVFVNGVDKEVVGQTASEIRKIRPPKHYKDGAGIRYLGENVRIKVGKKLAA